MAAAGAQEGRSQASQRAEEAAEAGGRGGGRREEKARRERAEAWTSERWMRETETGTGHRHALPSCPAPTIPSGTLPPIWHLLISRPPRPAQTTPPPSRSLFPAVHIAVVSTRLLRSRIARPTHPSLCTVIDERAWCLSLSPTSNCTDPTPMHLAASQASQDGVLVSSTISLLSFLKLKSGCSAVYVCAPLRHGTARGPVV